MTEHKRISGQAASDDARHADMSYKACRDRYEAERAKIHARIRSGAVSASMSGIEYYPAPWDELKDMTVLQISLCWDGVEHTRRDWQGMLRENHLLFAA